MSLKQSLMLRLRGVTGASMSKCLMNLIKIVCVNIMNNGFISL